MNEIRLLFGRPVIRERERLISAIRELQLRCNCIAQILDADLVVSERHIRFAANKALHAMSDGRNIARDPGMEIMRYASGERQIERARVMGVTDRTQRIALFLADPDERGRLPGPEELSEIIQPDLQGTSFDEGAVISLFHITPEELSTVGRERIEELVIERVALADTYR